jgi:CRISPR/Cas system CSM-associated protein Csm3 (group 7 of RAMP superfamily)
MFGKRWQISLQLVSTTDAHIGTGDRIAFGSKPDTGYATIAKDHAGRPYIPGSTMKGALRGIAEVMVSVGTNLELLLGSIRDSTLAGEATGQAGRLLVRAAEFFKSPDLAALPYVKTENLRHSFIAARTRIEESTGVAADHNLYFAEMIPTGTVFTWTMLLTHEGALPLLRKVLAQAFETGLQLGRGQSDGQGEFAIQNDISIVEHHIVNGKLVAGNKEYIRKPAQKASNAKLIELHCEGPFIVNDSSWNSAEEPKANSPSAKGQKAQLKAQRRNAVKPLLLGSTVSGALRARAAWLNALMPADESKDKDTVLDSLFGKTDYKALVEIRHLDVRDATPFSLTSLKIDRFSGAPIDGALFTTETFIGTRIRFSLALKKRGTKPVPARVDTLFKMLDKDVREHGLTLGQGTTKGFGWFKPVSAKG